MNKCNDNASNEKILLIPSIKYCRKKSGKKERYCNFINK